MFLSKTGQNEEYLSSVSYIGLLHFLFKVQDASFAHEEDAVEEILVDEILNEHGVGSEILCKM